LWGCYIYVLSWSEKGSQLPRWLLFVDCSASGVSSPLSYQLQIPQAGAALIAGMVAAPLAQLH